MVLQLDRIAEEEEQLRLEEVGVVGGFNVDFLAAFTVFKDPTSALIIPKHPLHTA
jgi:hypothetical protein